MKTARAPTSSDLPDHRPDSTRRRRPGRTTQDWTESRYLSRGVLSRSRADQSPPQIPGCPPCSTDTSNVYDGLVKTALVGGSIDGIATVTLLLAPGVALDTLRLAKSSCTDLFEGLIRGACVRSGKYER